jgi:hypothetical protein
MPVSSLYLKCRWRWPGNEIMFTAAAFPRTAGLPRWFTPPCPPRRHAPPRLRCHQLLVFCHVPRHTTHHGNLIIDVILGRSTGGDVGFWAFRLQAMSPLLRQCRRYGVNYDRVGTFPWLVGTPTRRIASIPPSGHPQQLGDPHLPWYLRGIGDHVSAMARFSVVRRGSSRCDARRRFRGQVVECAHPGGNVPQERECEGRQRRHGHGSCLIDCL